MITLAESLKMSVVAEGVETYEQYQILKQMGCKIIQGYLFSKPLPATEFEKLLKIGTIDIPNVPNRKSIIRGKKKIFQSPSLFPTKWFNDSNTY